MEVDLVVGPESHPAKLEVTFGIGNISGIVNLFGIKGDPKLFKTLSMQEVVHLSMIRLPQWFSMQQSKMIVKFLCLEQYGYMGFDFDMIENNYQPYYYCTKYFHYTKKRRIGC